MRKTFSPADTGGVFPVPPLEDRRDQWGPARVLHAAVEIAGIAQSGPIPPNQSPLPAGRHEALREALRAFEDQAVKVAG